MGPALITTVSLAAVDDVGVDGEVRIHEAHLVLELVRHTLGIGIRKGVNNNTKCKLIEWSNIGKTSSATVSAAVR